MKRKFWFQLDIDGDDVGEEGVIEIEDSVIQEGLSKEFRDSFYTFKAEHEVVAHIAWAMVVRNYRPSEIEGWIMTDTDAKIIEYPSGYDNYGCTAGEIFAPPEAGSGRGLTS